MEVAGFCAKLLGEDKLYNQLKDAYNTLKDQWESSTNDYCQKKSKTNWLGGGDIYAAFSCPKWGENEDIYIRALKDLNRQDLIKELNKLIVELNRKY